MKPIASPLPAAATMLLAALAGFGTAVPIAWAGEKAETVPIGLPASESLKPALGFTSGRYALNPEHLIFRRGTREDLGGEDRSWQGDGQPSGTDRYFARVLVDRREGDEPDATLRFKVESLPDRESYEFCYCPLHETSNACYEKPRDCHPLEVEVGEGDGLLYLVVPAATDRSNPKKIYYYPKDYETQRAELSIAESTLKVYREVLIDPPVTVPDCSDYPENDIDRYMCLFQGETLPPAPPPDEALRAGLPSGLLQPPENYVLIFSEDFDGQVGRRPSGLCEGGLSNLDSDKWSFPDDWCEQVDAEGTPCQGMEDGRYYMSVTKTCGGGVGTQGKFAYKYGYLETKYTVNLDESYSQILAFVVGQNRRKPLKYANAKYGVEVRDYEDITRYIALEIDLFEYFPEKRWEVAHRFLNYFPHVNYRNTVPKSTTKYTKYCAYTEDSDRRQNFLTASECAELGELTVTKGMEWTPRGYRWFMKVDGVHDDFIVVRKESTRINTYPATTNTVPVQFGGPVRVVGSARDSYFEFEDPANPDTVLEKLAVAHTPLNVWLSAWSGFGNEFTDEEDTIRTKLKLDYVRVFQPGNRYADLDPVFK